MNEKKDEYLEYTYSNIMAFCRELDKQTESLKVRARKPLKIVMAGNVSMEFLKYGTRAALAAKEYEASINCLAYDSWVSVALTENSTTADFWIIWVSSQGLSKGGSHRPNVDVDGITSAVLALKKLGVRIIVIYPEPLSVDNMIESEFTSWRHALINELDNQLPQGVVKFRLDSFIGLIGQDSWTSPRYWTAAKIPCHPDAAVKLGGRMGSLVAEIINPKVRAIISDLDDTLWGGIVGDDGVEGLLLDSDGRGRPFLSLQRLLKDLCNRGVPLSVVSKNSMVNAHEPFKKRIEMILKLDDFVYFEASWNEKYKSILKIIGDLNLSPDQVLFLDDSIFERDQAKKFIPSLLVPDLPSDPDDRVDFIIRKFFLDKVAIDKESESRVAMYKEEKMRQDTRAEYTNVGDYLMHLEMKLVPEKVGPDNLARVVNLIQKTNQWNLTNNKTTADEIAGYLRSNQSFVYAYSLTDKYGDYGIISALIARDCTGEIELLEWVMSCRVFNRAVESAVFKHFMDWAVSVKFNVLRCKYGRTTKNQLCESFIKSIGFEHLHINDDIYECKLPVQLSSQVQIL